MLTDGRSVTLRLQRLHVGGPRPPAGYERELGVWPLLLPAELRLLRSVAEVHSLTVSVPFHWRDGLPAFHNDARLDRLRLVKFQHLPMSEVADWAGALLTVDHGAATAVHLEGVDCITWQHWRTLVHCTRGAPRVTLDGCTFLQRPPAAGEDAAGAPGGDWCPDDEMDRWSNLATLTMVYIPMTPWPVLRYFCYSTTAIARLEVSTWGLDREGLADLLRGRLPQAQRRVGTIALGDIPAVGARQTHGRVAELDRVHSFQLMQVLPAVRFELSFAGHIATGRVLDLFAALRGVHPASDGWTVDVGDWAGLDYAVRDVWARHRDEVRGAVQPVVDEGALVVTATPATTDSLMELATWLSVWLRLVQQVARRFRVDFVGVPQLATAMWPHIPQARELLRVATGVSGVVPYLRGERTASIEGTFGQQVLDPADYGA